MDDTAFQWILGEWQQHQVTTLYNRCLKPQLRWSQFILATVLGHLAATNDVVYDFLLWKESLGGGFKYFFYFHPYLGK